MTLKGLKKGLMIPNEIWEIEELNTIEKCLLAVYNYYSKFYDKTCTFADRTLAEFLKVDERTIRTYNSHLKELGLIEVEYKSKRVKKLYS